MPSSRIAATLSPMIARVWRGWTSPENADEYERLLKERIFPDILEKGVEGYRGARLFRRSLERDGGKAAEVEFETILYFASLDAVRAFAGEEYDRAYVPDAARAILERFDERSLHYEVREYVNYGTRLDFHDFGPREEL